MQNFLVVLFSIVVVVLLLYFILKVMMENESSSKPGEDLQITSDDILAQLNILYRQKKYNIVENLAKKYLEKKPYDVAVRTILAKSLHANGRSNDAITHVKFVISRDLKNLEIKIFLANLYLETQAQAKAITVLREVLEVDENNVVAIKLLAKVYFDTNQKVLSIKLYEKLEEFLYSNQEKANNKKLLAKMHTALKNYDKAIAEYTGILEFYPADIEVRKELVNLFRMTSNYEMLIETGEEVLSLHSSEENDLWALDLLLDFFISSKDYEKALEYAARLKEHQLSNKVKVSENIARIFMETGRVDESINLLTDLINANAGNISLKRTLARSFISKGDFEHAVSIYKKILDEAGLDQIKGIHYDLSNLYSKWGEYLFSLGNNEDCFKKFATAVQYDSENPHIYYLLGVVNQSIKNFNEAISQYKKAIDLDVEAASYYFSIAECYAAIDSFYEEKRALFECIKYNPTNAKAQFRLAELFEIQHETNSAIAFLRSAIAANDNMIEAKYKLALILERQGNTEEAIEIYNDILFRDPEHNGALENLKMLKA